MAVGSMSAATELGLPVPLKHYPSSVLTTFVWPHITNPPLTTISQPKHEIGLMAIEMLLDRMRDPDSPARFRRFDTELYVRQSTAPYAET